MSNDEDFDFSWYDAQIAEISVLFKSNSNLREQAREQTRAQTLIYYRILVQSLIDFPVDYSIQTKSKTNCLIKLAEKFGISKRTLSDWRNAAQKFSNENELDTYMLEHNVYAWTTVVYRTIRTAGNTVVVNVPAEVVKKLDITPAQIRKIIHVYFSYAEIQYDLQQLAKEMKAEGKL